MNINNVVFNRFLTKRITPGEVQVGAAGGAVEFVPPRSISRHRGAQGQRGLRLHVASRIITIHPSCEIFARLVETLPRHQRRYDRRQKIMHTAAESRKKTNNQGLLKWTVQSKFGDRIEGYDYYEFPFFVCHMIETRFSPHLELPPYHLYEAIFPFFDQFKRSYIPFDQPHQPFEFPFVYDTSYRVFS